jgi:hypothetical protein
LRPAPGLYVNDCYRSPSAGNDTRRERRAAPKRGPALGSDGSATAGDFDGRACIGARSAEPEVPAGPTVQPVIACVPCQFVGSGLTEEAIVTSATGSLILPAAGEDSVSSASAGNLIVPATSTDDVVTATPLNLVGTAACDDHIPGRGTPNLVRAGRADDRCIQSRALWLKGCLRAGRRREGRRQNNHRNGCGNRRDDAKSTLPGHTFLLGRH